MRKTSEEMHEIAKRYESYEGTKRDFCLRHGVKIHVLDYWRKKINPGKKEETSGGFVELLQSQRQPDCYRLFSPNGLRLELPFSTPIEVLEKLLRVPLEGSKTAEHV